MLASVYSYRVMVKSVSSCCVRGRWVLSNPVTYVTGYSNTDHQFEDKSVIQTVAGYTKILYAHHWKDTPEPKRTRQ